MTTFYSEHYAQRSSATVAPPTAVADFRQFTEGSEAPRGTLVHSIARIFFDAKTDIFVDFDTIHCFPLRTSDRVIGTYASMNNTQFDYTALDVHVGFYPVEQRDGRDFTHLNALDENFWVDGQDVTSLATRVTFQTDTDVYADKLAMPLWLLYNERAGSTVYASDPRETWDLVCTVDDTVDTLTSNGELTVECLYIRGGKG